MSKPFVVIIAGGKGERFWPQSRAPRPKHLLPVVGREPLLTQTLKRVRGLAPANHIFVITSSIQLPAARKVCRGLVPAANIVAEPVGRDTAAAVGLAAALVARRDPEGVFAILPADHVIHDGKSYQKDLKAAFAVASSERVMVTIGISPTEPATGFGYIQRGAQFTERDGRPVFRVKRFVEKPKLDVARRYLESGDYFWNAGMFVWSVPVVTAAFGEHAPELSEGLAKIRAALGRRRPLKDVLAKIYPHLPRISVDYALLEKSSNVVVIPSSFDWDDVGAWPAVARHFPSDDRGNVCQGNAIVENGTGNLVVSDGRHLVSVLGVENLIVVHTPDATLVCPKDKAQEIKSLLKRVAALKNGARWL